MKSNKRKIIGILGGLFCLFAFNSEAAQDFSKMKARSEKRAVIHGSYIERGAGGCSTCHVNRGVGGFADHEEWTCFHCHSDINDSEVESRSPAKRWPYIRKKIAARYMEKSKELDILSVYRKEYTHPTLTISGKHSHVEVLSGPGEAPRHAECIDCHDPHEVSEWNPFGPVAAVGKTGIVKKLKRIGEMSEGEPVQEYELCFNCHADNINLPVDQTNKRIEFDENNPSYHPVLSEGKNSYVPSLLPPYKKTNDISIIKCSDCHNNNDPQEAQGPHGSDYRFILKSRYSIEDGLTENLSEYALCYDCHRRSSILGNQSFPFHAEHITGDIAKGIKGTSCFTCHDAHGSREYTNLIRFNEDVVFPNSSTMELQFIDDGMFSGSCTLSCHDVNHNSWSYGSTSQVN